MIDRKGDLIKLQLWELFCLSKVQSILTAKSLVHQFCAIARSTENVLFPIIVANWPKLDDLITDIVPDITKNNLVQGVPKIGDAITKF